MTTRGPFGMLFGLLQDLPHRIEESKIRSQIQLRDPSHQEPEELEIRIAETESDLERAFQLAHDRAVADGVLKPLASGMRLLPQHLFPQTSTIIARWEGEIVGAVSLFRENAIGLPIEKAEDLASLRQSGKRLGEASVVAILPERLENPGEVFFPLFRFLYHYASECFGIQKLIVQVPPSSRAVYQAFFGFEQHGEHMLLDLEEAPIRWQSMYGAKIAEKNLMKYLLHRPDSPRGSIPSRQYAFAAHWVLTPQMLEHLFLKKSGLLHTLKNEEARAFCDAYPYESYQSVIHACRWTEAKPPLREMRMDAQMYASIEENQSGVDVRNISRHGLQIWSDQHLEPRQVITLNVWINPSEQTQVRAQVRWNDGAGCYGLRILSYSSEWGKLIQSIEERFQSRLSAARAR